MQPKRIKYTFIEKDLDVVPNERDNEEIQNL